MKRTLLRLGFIGLFALLSCLAYLWFTMPHDRIDRASFDKITKGMSRQEVESLLRCPPGKYCSDSALVEVPRPDGSIGGIAVDEIFEADCQLDGMRQVCWAGDNGVIVVLLDAKGKVVEKQFGTMYTEGFITKARRWLASIL